MKSLICLIAVVSVAVCMPQGALQGEPQAAAAPQAAGAAAPAAAGTPAGLGPQFFGPGLANTFALPPNQQQISVAQQVVAANPNVRVFVGVDGQIEFTDQFGREVEVVDSFGRDPLEFVSPQEQFERQQEVRELQLKQARQQAKFQAQENLLRQLTGGVGGAANPALLGADLENLEELSELHALRNFQQQQQQQQQGAQPAVAAQNFGFQ